MQSTVVDISLRRLDRVYVYSSIASSICSCMHGAPASVARLFFLPTIINQDDSLTKGSDGASDAGRCMRAFRRCVLCSVQLCYLVLGFISQLGSFMLYMLCQYCSFQMKTLAAGSQTRTHQMHMRFMVQFSQCSVQLCTCEWAVQHVVAAGT